MGSGQGGIRSADHMGRKKLAGFAADATVGRLVKWLRLAGLDTVFEAGRPEPGKLAGHLDQGRIGLTRSFKVARRFTPGKVILINDDHVAGQFRQVMEQAGLGADDLLPFSRCSLCNGVLERVGRDLIRGLVPDYIWHTAESFKQCRDCHRIYWPGSHVQRGRRILASWLAPAAREDSCRRGE